MDLTQRNLTYDLSPLSEAAFPGSKQLLRGLNAALQVSAAQASNDFGKILVWVRAKVLHIGAAEAAERFGLEKNSLTKIERGRLPNHKTVDAIITTLRGLIAEADEAKRPFLEQAERDLVKAAALRNEDPVARKLLTWSYSMGIGRFESVTGLSLELISERARNGYHYSMRELREIFTVCRRELGEPGKAGNPWNDPAFKRLVVVQLSKTTDSKALHYLKLMADFAGHPIHEHWLRDSTELGMNREQINAVARAVLLPCLRNWDPTPLIAALKLSEELPKSAIEHFHALWRAESETLSSEGTRETLQRLAAERSISHYRLGKALQPENWVETGATIRRYFESGRSAPIAAPPGLLIDLIADSDRERTVLLRNARREIALGHRVGAKNQILREAHLFGVDPSAAIPSASTIEGRITAEVKRDLIAAAIERRRHEVFVQWIRRSEISPPATVIQNIIGGDRGKLTEVAERSGLYPSLLQEYMHGTKYPQLHVYRRILESQSHSLTPLHRLYWQLGYADRLAAEGLGPIYRAFEVLEHERYEHSAPPWKTVAGIEENGWFKAKRAFREESPNESHRAIAAKAFDLGAAPARAIYLAQLYEFGRTATALARWSGAAGEAGLHRGYAKVQELKAIPRAAIEQFESRDLAKSLSIEELSFLARRQRISSPSTLEWPTGSTTPEGSMLRTICEVAPFFPGATWNELRSGLRLGF